jgi:hypothetical protein
LFFPLKKRGVNGKKEVNGRRKLMGEGKMKRGEVLCSIIAQPITFLSFFRLIQAIGTHCSNKIKLIVPTV